MDWLEFVAPSAAIMALFIAVALVVQSIRHGRAIKRVEERLTQNGSAAVEASLERVQQLQARAAISSGEAPRGVLRSALLALLGVLVIAGAGVAVWLFVLRGDGASAGSNPRQEPPPAAATTTTGTVGTTAPAGPGTTTAPGDVAPIANPARYELAVWNATGVVGAAGEGAAPLLIAEGWQVPEENIQNEINGIRDLATSQVQYPEGQRRVAEAVAQDLGIEAVGPLDGYTEEQIGGADALVLVGEDLAEELLGQTP